MKPRTTSSRASARSGRAAAGEVARQHRFPTRDHARQQVATALGDQRAMFAGDLAADQRRPLADGLDHRRAVQAQLRRQPGGCGPPVDAAAGVRLPSPVGPFQVGRTGLQARVAGPEHRVVQVQRHCHVLRAGHRESVADQPPHLGVVVIECDRPGCEAELALRIAGAADALAQPTHEGLDRRPVGNVLQHGRRTHRLRGCGGSGEHLEDEVARLIAGRCRGSGDGGAAAEPDAGCDGRRRTGAAPRPRQPKALHPSQASGAASAASSACT